MCTCIHVYICTINEGCKRTHLHRPPRFTKTKHIYQIPAHLFILQHLLNNLLNHLLNNFNRYFFFCPLLKNIREVKKFYSWKTHVEVQDIHTKILAAGFNKTTALQIFHCDKNDTSIEKKTKKYSVWIFLIVF